MADDGDRNANADSIPSMDEIVHPVRSPSSGFAKWSAPAISPFALAGVMRSENPR